MGEQGFFAAVCALFTKFIAPWIPGACGSIVALHFLRKGVKVWQKIIYFITGVAFMYYIAPAVIEASNVTGPALMDSIKFGCGLFGYSLIQKLFTEIADVKLFSRAMDKWFGVK